ncbi:hypothetical protein KY334_07625, partial [Candidatus Woesearchaeota archaeon]|nr:hypothetical protein [Candidatus Woesearchaeota archaeon]
DSMKHKLSDIIETKVTNMIDKEIINLNSKLKNLDNIEKEFDNFVNEVNKLKEELSKFNKISKEIKEVDFTLEKHTGLIQKIERKKIYLEEENEKLKSLMARMKRHKN